MVPKSTPLTITLCYFFWMQSVVCLRFSSKKVMNSCHFLSKAHSKCWKQTLDLVNGEGGARERNEVWVEENRKERRERREGKSREKGCHVWTLSPGIKH